MQIQGAGKTVRAMQKADRAQAARLLGDFFTDIPLTGDDAEDHWWTFCRGCAAKTEAARETYGAGIHPFRSGVDYKIAYVGVVDTLPNEIAFFQWCIVTGTEVDLKMVAVLPKYRGTQTFAEFQSLMRKFSYMTNNLQRAILTVDANYAWATDPASPTWSVLDTFESKREDGRMMTRYALDRPNVVTWLAANPQHDPAITFTPWT